MNRIIVFGFLVVAWAGFSGSAIAADSCTPKHHFSTVKKGQITAMVTDLPPWSRVKDGKAIGVDGEILNKIAEMECLKVKPVKATYTSAFSAVKTGRADLMIGAFYITKTRGKVLGQTNPIYVDYVVFISKSGINKVSQLKGKQVATVQGFAWNKDLSKVVPAKNLHTYQASVQAMNDLVSGRVDVFVEGLGEGTYRAKKRGGDFKVEIVKPSPKIKSTEHPARINFPHTKGNEGMEKALNDDIATLQKNGTIKKIIVNAGLDPIIAKIPDEDQ